MQSCARMKTLPRREVLEGLVSVAGAFTLLRALTATQAWGADVRPTALAWVAQVRELCLDLKATRLLPHVWQQQIAALFARVPLADLLKSVELERLVAGLTWPEEDAANLDVTLPGLEGVSPKQLITSVFGVRQGHAVVPHGHHNMASTHVVLQGGLRVRHFDRVADAPDHLMLKPVSDVDSREGDSSSVSDEAGNVHWFIATRGPAFLLDVIVPKRDPERSWGRDYVDPLNAVAQRDGLLRMPRLSAREAIRRYDLAV